MPITDKSTIISLLGAYDNLSEAVPAWNRPTTIITVSLVFLALLWACAAFRIYTRFRIIYSPGWDDFFVVLVVILSSIGTVCVCLATAHGLGEHFLLLTFDTSMKYLKLFYIANATYAFSTAFVKVSLLIQYLRLFKEEPRMRWICFAVMAFTALWSTAYGFMSWFPCFPVYGYWTWTVASTCYGFGSPNSATFFATYASHSGINMALDFIVLLIPTPLLFRKNTSNKTKIALLGLLFMGGCVNFLSIWRVATVVQHRAGTTPTFDPTWYGPISILLATLEVDVAGICASVPVFWPVLTAKIDQIFVTKEITIEHSHRFSHMADDEYELERNATAASKKYDRPSMQSRTTSEESLSRRPSTKEVQAGVTDAHYLDQYVAAQVDPLSRSCGVELEITAGVPKKKSKSRGAF